MAIAACRAYVEELIRLDDERKAIRIATALFQLAGSATGLQAYAKHGLDILEAIPLSRFSNTNFRTEQAARSLANVSKARENLSTGTSKR